MNLHEWGQGSPMLCAEITQHFGLKLLCTSTEILFSIETIDQISALVNDKWMTITKTMNVLSYLKYSNNKTHNIKCAGFFAKAVWVKVSGTLLDGWVWGSATKCQA